MDRSDELLKASEVAKLLGVSTHAVTKWLRERRIPAVQYGEHGIYRVRRGDVLAFMEASRRATQPIAEDDAGTKLEPDGG